MFDCVVVVDWSAANQPKTGRDSIWIGIRAAPSGAATVLHNPPTRAAARAVIEATLTAATRRDERVLLGFDFPFGYPAGFAARLGLPGPPWRASWDLIAGLIADGADNRNNRFAVAAELNRRIAGAPFPFWGCPTAAASPWLGPRHHRRHDTDPLKERRIIDGYMRTAQPCWKLLGAGSVGGQALTGIPVVRALRDDPRWCRETRVWPFETGLRAVDDARIVLAEIYPSWWKIRPDPGEVKDAAQVRTVAALLADAARAGGLAALFAGAPELTPAQRRVIQGEEAWTLGVTASPARPQH